MDLGKPRGNRMPLYDAIQIGRLRNENAQEKALQRYGYQLDRRISDGRQTMVAYQPKQNKVLFVANGTDTKSEKDLITDFVLVQGGLKETRRYRETKQAYEQAKDKYKNAKFVDVGYSLGGALINQVASSKDRALTYNAAFTPGQKVRPHVRNIHVAGDWISAYTPPARTQIIEPVKEEIGRNPFLKYHETGHIKDAKIFV